MLSDMESVFDFSKNFAGYRELEQEAPFPKIPFLGLFMKDMAAIKESHLYIHQGMFDFGLSWAMYDHFSLITAAQTVPYRFETIGTDTQDPMFQYCSTLPAENEQTLCSVSKLLEPPEELETESGFLSSIWKNVGDSLTVLMMKLYEQRGSSPIDRVKRKRYSLRRMSVNRVLSNPFTSP